jgi:hypothetical protein
LLFLVGPSHGCYQENPTLEKLDRVLISRDWELLFPTVYVYKYPRAMSNHNPLVVSSQKVQLKKVRTFRFELRLKESEALYKIKEIWEAPTRDVKALERVFFKMKKVRKFLKGWGFNRAVL